MGFVPLTIAPGAKPTAGKGVKGLGVVPGGTQVTENDFPRFLFSADYPHPAMGQGLTSSGGTWHAPTVQVAKRKKKGGGSNAGTGGVSFSSRFARIGLDGRPEGVQSKGRRWPTAGRPMALGGTRGVRHLQLAVPAAPAS
jgi:hypothetical protein